MGTLFSITLFAADEGAAREAAKAAFERINRLEDIMSDYQADSELNQLREQPAGKPVRVSGDLFAVLEQAQHLSRVSGGAFDVTIGPYARLWRFARKRQVLASSAEMARAAAAVGWEKLRLYPRTQTVTLLAPSMQLDLGGIAKGYAADEALRVLGGRGIHRALVAASGDIALGDPPPGQRGWRIAVAGVLQDRRAADGGPYTARDSPGDASDVAARIVLRNCGVSTSGDTEQSIQIEGVRYSHILDPRTGLGLTNRIQATVIAPNATTSDPLATTVCVLGPTRGLALANSMSGTAAFILAEEQGTRRVLTNRRFDRLKRASESRSTSAVQPGLATP